MSVGHGYLSSIGEKKGEVCIEGDIIQQQNSYWVVEYSSEVSEVEIERLLKVGLEAVAEINLLFFTVNIKAGARFLHSVKESRYSKSYIFAIGGQLGSSELDIRSYGLSNLNKRGKESYRLGNDKFKEVCGDRFIKKEYFESKIYLAVKYNFYTRLEKSEFELSGVIKGFSGALKKGGLSNFPELKEVRHQVSGHVYYVGIKFTEVIDLSFGILKLNKLTEMRTGGFSFKLKKLLGMAFPEYKRACKLIEKDGVCVRYEKNILYNYGSKNSCYNEERCITDKYALDIGMKGCASVECEERLGNYILEKVVEQCRINKSKLECIQDSMEMILSYAGENLGSQYDKGNVFTNLYETMGYEVIGIGGRLRNSQDLLMNRRALQRGIEKYREKKEFIERVVDLHFKSTEKAAKELSRHKDVHRSQKIIRMLEKHFTEYGAREKAVAKAGGMEKEFAKKLLYHLGSHRIKIGDKLKTGRDKLEMKGTSLEGVKLHWDQKHISLEIKERLWGELEIFKKGLNRCKEECYDEWQEGCDDICDNVINDNTAYAAIKEFEVAYLTNVRCGKEDIMDNRSYLLPIGGGKYKDSGREYNIETIKNSSIMLEVGGCKINAEKSADYVLTDIYSATIENKKECNLQICGDETEELSWLELIEIDTPL